MAKKKEKKVFNIDEVNLEIDYDKLAAAIVRANAQQTEKYSVSREWMKFMIYPVFWGVAIVSGVLALGCLIYGGGLFATELAAIPDTNWSNVIVGALVLSISFFLVSVSMSTVFTAKEIDKEKDRQYVASMFSNIVALVALVVSLVALVKG